MNVTRRGFLGLASLSAAGLAGCLRPQLPSDGGSSASPADDGSSSSQKVDAAEFEALTLDETAWHYDKKSDCFYQLNLSYCLNPGSKANEALAIFVPGRYFQSTRHGDTYACEVRKEATLGTFTPGTAPVVMPINGDALAAQTVPTSYSYEGLDRYLSKGIVYVYAGFRGRSSGFESDSNDLYSGGSPWPAVDLKAAVRYLRYNAKKLPCDTDRIFMMGYGLGGGLSAVMGSTGDSRLYSPYLAQIGAATHDAKGNSLSDAICGSASWCPKTSLGSSDAALEWMMGQFSSGGTRKDGTWTKLLSGDLASAYGDYINELGLVDSDGNQLGLDSVQVGTYLDGSYYTKLMETIQKSATTFFSKTQFPYTSTPGVMPRVAFPGDPNLSLDEAAGEDSDEGDADSGSSGVTSVESKVYDSSDAYISSLNGDGWWLTYSSARQQANVSDLWDFVKSCKSTSLQVLANDRTDRSSVTNQLFGIDDESTLHFERMVSDLLSSKADDYAAGDGWDNSLVNAWAEDLSKKDALGTSMELRESMFDPLYFLSASSKGSGSSKLAAHWRINTGLFSKENTLTCELNLALALDAAKSVKDVAFTPVWGKGYELAELSGDAQENFVTWVGSCCAADDKDKS